MSCRLQVPGVALYCPAGYNRRMKVTYDAEVDVLSVVFSHAPVEESDEDKPGVVIDYDKDGNVVGIEILEASRRVDNPRAVEHAVAG